MRKKSSFTVELHASHNEVTGSSFLLVENHPNGDVKKYLVEHGIYQESAYRELNTILDFKPEELDGVFITHNHADHISNVPHLVANGFGTRISPLQYIYCTDLTKGLMRIGLPDSYRIMKDTYARPLYYPEHIEKTFALTKGVNYNKAIKISDTLEVTFCGNAHLLGAACIFFHFTYPGKDEINFLFTGDYKKDTIFFDVPSIPDEIKNARNLTIVCEATYATSKSTDIMSHFLTDMQQIIQNFTTCIIPCIAQGRTSEVLYQLKMLQDLGFLSLDTPIYITSSLAQRYLCFYEKNCILDFMPQNVIFVDKNNWEELFKPGKKIIIAASGMLDHGRIVDLLPYYLPREDTTVYITCYQPPGTTGNILMNIPKGEQIKLRPKPVTANVTIYKTEEFSSHAKGDEILEFLEVFQNVVSYIINHGQTKSKEYLHELITEHFCTWSAYISDRNVYHVINCTGVIGVHPSKLLSNEEWSRISNQKKEPKKLSHTKKKKERTHKKSKCHNFRTRNF